MRRGFTLVELLLTVSIAVTIAALAVPMVLGTAPSTADSAARLLFSDLEHAQMLAVANPESRIGLAVDGDGGGWRIVDADSPGQPWVDRLDDLATPRVLEVRMGHGRAATCTDAVITPTGATIVFDPLGGLETPTGNDRALIVTCSDASRLLRIDSDTGFLTLVQN